MRDHLAQVPAMLMRVQGKVNRHLVKGTDTPRNPTHPSTGSLVHTVTFDWIEHTSCASVTASR